MTNKQKATDFLDKCRTISAIDQVKGIFVEINANGDIGIKRGYIHNGVYDVEVLDEMSITEIIEAKPYETILTFKRRIGECIGRKHYYIDESLYNTLCDINKNGYVVLEDEDFNEDEY